MNNSKILGIMFVFLTIIIQSLKAQGTIILAGGGAESDQGIKSAWSYKLFSKLIENGDTNQDSIIRVAIISTGTSDSFLRNYFAWIGTTLEKTVEATDFKVSSRSDANDSSLIGAVKNADVIFLKGGDQGVNYDLWNETLLETNIRLVISRNGAIGGTSAGAMCISAFSFSGSKDLISSDVLTDSKTAYLDDDSEPGTSGIHTDFLSFLDNTLVDTHFTQRGRLGRLIGLLGKAVEDFSNKSILGIGIEQKTGLFIKGNTAEVIGNGAVYFIQEKPESMLKREQNRPLFYTNLRLDRLTEGWKFNLASNLPDSENLPENVEDVTFSESEIENSSALTINGGIENEKLKFEKLISIYPADFEVQISSESSIIAQSLGFTDVGNSSNRMDKQEALFHGLYESASSTGFLLLKGGEISRSSENPDLLNFSQSGTAKEPSTIVIDTKTATHKNLSKSSSNYAISRGKLKAASFVNLTLHVLAESEKEDRGYVYNSKTHTLQSKTSVSIQSEKELTPKNFKIGNAYPNPFNPNTIFPIQLGKSSTLSLRIMNALGQLVYSIRDVVYSQGRHELFWDASNESSGVYLVAIKIDGKVNYQKVTLLK